MFDTGHCYGKDLSVMFGKWIQDRNVRDKVVILAKGAHPYGHNRVTPEDITSDLHDTLEWMGVDHVELLVLHRDDPSVPVGPIVDVLNAHQKAGKIGAFGGSNWIQPSDPGSERLCPGEWPDPVHRQQPELQPGRAGGRALGRLPLHQRPRRRGGAALLRPVERRVDALVQSRRRLLLRPLPSG